MYVTQTENEINFYHCSYGKIRLTSNISRWDIRCWSWRSSDSFLLALWTL